MGNDTYIVDSTDITVVEDASGGTDTIRTSLSTWSLASQTTVENISYTGVGAFSGTGNALANLIEGRDGNDTLDGGAGADTLVGGLGDDVYYVDSASDKITELTNGGTDAVVSSASYTLAANLETITLKAGLTSPNINATGNELANRLTGNEGSNILDGKAGADTMVGGLAATPTWWTMSATW